jgi:hypothetical protein
MRYLWLVTFGGEFHTVKYLSLHTAQQKADKFATDARIRGVKWKSRVVQADKDTGKVKVVYTGKYDKRYEKWAKAGVVRNKSIFDQLKKRRS